jgi:hypothetical protein
MLLPYPSFVSSIIRLGSGSSGVERREFADHKLWLFFLHIASPDDRCVCVGKCVNISCLLLCPEAPNISDS